MKEFVLTKIYGCASGSSCANGRAAKWCTLEKKNTLQLPPDKDSLYHCLCRTNYLVFCQKHFRLSEHPSATSHGWLLINGRCRPIRHQVSSLPRAVNWMPIDQEAESSDDDTEFDESELSENE